MQRVVVREEKNLVYAIVEEDNIPKVLGRGGSSVKLATNITGWQISLMSPDNFEAVEKQDMLMSQEKMKEELGLEDELFDKLALMQFASIEELGEFSEEEIIKATGLESEVVQEIVSKVEDILLMKAFDDEEESTLDEQNQDQAPEDDSNPTVEDIPELTIEEIQTLKESGVMSRDNLADLSVDELLDIIPEFGSRRASDLIIKSRQHWFQKDI